MKTVRIEMSGLARLIEVINQAKSDYPTLPIELWDEGEMQMSFPPEPLALMDCPSASRN